MKKYILTFCIACLTFIVNAQDSLALLEVVVTDFKNIPQAGEQIIFEGVTNGKSFYGVSGKDGKFMIGLFGGDVYQIKIKSVGETMNYSTIEIPTLSDGESYVGAQIQLQFELPKTFTLDNVYFDSGKATLKKESYQELNELIEYMSLKESIKIEIAGHTDNVGDEGSNLNLSQLRADKVKAYLVSKGISIDRIIAKGYGEVMPIADNSTELGKTKNRRIEVRIVSE